MNYVDVTDTPVRDGQIKLYDPRVAFPGMAAAGRVARLIELDPKYADVIVRRWQDWTGKQTTRESDGLAFDQAATSSSTISQ